ncbi:MAG: S8 family serine peptidase [Actinobacteria bacterium]|nr:S8 family serine peptidase [Actinomycetota bacterium]
MQRTTRGWKWCVAAAVTAGATLVGVAAPLGASVSYHGAPVNVIVRATDGDLAQAERAVTADGGRVGRVLSIINGFGATVPADAVAALDQSDGVASVSTDARVTPMSVDPSLGYDATGDFGSMSNVTSLIGAQDLWAAGYTGKGVDVALVDTGVAPVPGIADKVVNGPDLSFDYQGGAPAGVDAFGHGTHMAGIIAGRDPAATASSVGCTTCLNQSGYSDTTKFVGVAPDSRIVNVKVGAFNGATDVSQVIAGIDWVVQHRNDNGLNIKVLNLSFGTDSAQPYTVDPLAYAAEVAWRHGIVVVAAAGNDGASATSLSDPAYDPTIVAVGASDPNNSTKIDQGFVAPFTNAGSDKRRVDVVAPGAHVISLRDPGSFVDTTYPTSEVGSRFTRGSGTSQAAAVTSGFVADLAQKFPQATPDQLKNLLTQSGQGIHHDGKLSDGKGLINAKKILDKKDLGNPTQKFDPATGTGSLDAARGTSHVTIDGQALTGEQDIFGNPWNGQRWSADSWNGTSWNGGLFEGQRWSGDTWDGLSWRNAAWDGNDWTGQHWRGQRWSDNTWDGQHWRSTTWDGQHWRDAAWDGQHWRGIGWTNNAWADYSWD